MIVSAARAAGLAAVLAFGAIPLAGHQTQQAQQQQPQQQQQQPQRQPDFDRMLQQQTETDKTWRTASDGFMQMDKIAYRSKVGDMDIPAFVFQPLKPRGAKAHPALVWVHENIR